MRGYFSQFGDISRLRMARNKKTGRSKHYAFIEFESADVAQIVAETMNNYLLFEHMLKCSVVPAEKVHEKLFIGCEKVYKPANYELHNRRMHNKPKTSKELEKKHNKLKKTEEKLREQIKKAGIEYDFPSFA
jgi:nucleolar protein 15